MVDSSNPQADMFVRRMLLVLNEEVLTKEQVYDKFKKLYPPSFIRKTIKKVLVQKPSITLKQVDIYLKMLAEYGFVSQEIKPWRKEGSSLVKVMVYSLTSKGRTYLNFKSPKK